MKDGFELTMSQLQEITLSFEKKVNEGLNLKNQEIKCLPTFIPSIKLPDNGDSYAIDLGGTNVRAATVSFENGECLIKKEPCEKKMPWERKKILDKNIYLDTQARVLESLNFNKECPLGYCFSYPAESTPDGDAKLIKWTKEINVPGVINEKIGDMLLKHLSKNYKKIQCSKVAVINDTVASLIAGLILPKVDAYIGLIVGTGTNMATFLDIDNISKLKNTNIKGFLPVNLESGNFTPPHLTKWDELVDEECLNKGEQRFEKTVSGAYLGNIFKKVYPESSFDSDTGAEGISELLNKAEKKDAYVLTASEIYNRSAKLIAASLAGLIKLLNGIKSVKTVRIVAEGSLFWGTIHGENRYLSITQSTLKSLLNEFDLREVSFKFENINNANLIGSAIAALS